LLAGVPTVSNSDHRDSSSGWQFAPGLERTANGLSALRNRRLFSRAKYSLVFDYFVFKHVAFCKIVWKKPMWATIGLFVFWKAFLQAPFASVTLAENSTAPKAALSCHEPPLFAGSLAIDASGPRLARAQ